ncbi:MAG: hypothetical protein IT165_20650 [Bryobacterales bacterium]|nr:hypothetical protein [Bryobacterales bacterium]
MTLERWRQVDDLFQQAADLPQEQRRAFLDQACGDDAGLGLAVRRHPEPKGISVPSRQVILEEPVPPPTVELPPPPRAENMPAKTADPAVDEARRRKAMDALNQ